MVDKVEEAQKIDTKEMQRIARETFPSEFMSRSTLNFEDHWELNLRIAYDDNFHNEFGSNAEARYGGIFWPNTKYSISDIRSCEINYILNVF